MTIKKHAQQRRPRSAVYVVFAGTLREFTGTLQEIAQHFGVKYGTFNNRVSNGMTLEDALQKPELKGHQGTVFTVYAGTPREFTGTLPLVAERFEASLTMLRRRVLRKGMTLE